MSSNCIKIKLEIEPGFLHNLQTVPKNDFDQIPGSISILINSREIVENPENNYEPIHDATISILIRLHQTLSSLVYPSDKEYNDDIFGIKFVHHRYALIFIHGSLFFRSEKQGAPPKENDIRHLRLDWGYAIQEATREIIDQILEFDSTMENHPVVCELRSRYQTTKKLLEDFKRICNKKA